MLLKRNLWLLLAASVVLSACAQKVTVATAPAPAVVETTAATAADQLLIEAENRFDQKDYTGALEAYDAFVRAYPTHDMVPVALMKIAAAYRALGDNDRARKAYEVVIANHPGHQLLQEAWVEVLASYSAEGRFDAVITNLAQVQEAVTEDDLRLRVNLLAGDAYMALDAPTEAARAYIRAYPLADDRVRDELRVRLASALRLLDQDVFNTLLSQIDDPVMAEMVAHLGRSLIYRRTTIGCLLPLSGAYQVFGQKALSGIELALAQASGENPTLELLVRDTDRKSVV